MNVTVDPEIEAMAEVSKALEKVDEEAKVRILDWANRRFGASTPDRSTQNDPAFSGESPPAASQQFAAFVDLFDKANPQSTAERALVGGYWFQVVQGSGSFKGQEINNALKDVGHGLSNVTDSLATLQERKPSLVRQVAKTGKSRQARKTYKLTEAGIREVERMMTGPSDPDES